MKRILVLSDAHGRTGNVFDAIDRHRKSLSLVLFCGDGERDIDAAEAYFQELRFVNVCGNCDFGSDLPVQQMVEFERKRILCTHGHIYHVKYSYRELTDAARCAGADICVFGHTHTPHTDYDDGLHLLNPGSIAAGHYGLIDFCDNGSVLCHLERL